MIISHKHKYIFIAIPKTGGHSIREALRASMGPEDLEQCGLLVKKRFPFPQTEHIVHGHITLQEIRPVIGEEIFSTYTKFAFVRNPFDRFVSFCAFMSTKHGNTKFKDDPLNYMKYVVREARPTDNVLYLPQYTFVTSGMGVLKLDLIGRTETMQSSFDEICDKLGLPRATLDRLNSSEHGSYQQYFDEELKDLVTDYYYNDLRLFNYEF